MSHWDAIGIAYVLTGIALAIEVGLLILRRRKAERQARESAT